MRSVRAPPPPRDDDRTEEGRAKQTVAEDERARGTVAEVPAEHERADRPGQGVGGDREPDEEAELPDRGSLDGKPRDSHDAHPVAEGRDAEPRQQPPCATVS